MKYILVTGANSGIGKSVTRKILDMGMGVIAIGLENIKISDEKVVECICDLCDENAINNIFDLCISQDICLSGMVHCAGICMKQEIQSITYEDMNKVYGINLFAFIELCRKFFDYDNRATKSSIIAISSITAQRAYRTQLLYASSKAALNSTVKCFAQEGIDKGILVNSVEFGAVETPMFSSLSPNMESITRHYPLGVLTTEEAASFIVELFSDKYGKMTGSVINFDSGFSVVH